jgi:hypothetical protein
MAHALLSRKAKAPPEDAVALYEGLSGSTPLPLAIEPGACYLVVAAITNGHARGLGLRATLGAQESRDERTSDDDAGVVAFCAGDHDLARLEVDARGATIRWGLAVFRVIGRQWQGVRER